MNQLKKIAKQELAAVYVFAPVILFCLIYFVRKDTQGYPYMLSLIVAIPAGVHVFQKGKKKEQQLDERERSIVQQAEHLVQTMILYYFMGFASITFFFVGGQGKIPVWLLPMMVFSGLLLGVSVRASMTLKQHEEDNNE